ncbi:MFS transporter [Actinophytocola sp.]|uniref:MFS transporter n=1 Tax=Actinophytocola sp. TaxID=1872138 RepID=UPI0025C4B322|nr:MFS transporter [Actinophytocola sp.]
MTVDTETGPTTPAARRGGRWIDDWDPDDERFWEATGKRIARKNLVFSIFAEHLGFAVWVLWSVVVLNLANVGLTMTLAETFWLTAIPNLIGSALRIPYTFAVPRFGGRLWTGVSAALLLIPAVLLATVVPSGWLAGQTHDTQFWVLFACAATAGFGGGNFSSSMANISFFYPERKKGFALGLNAAGGNLGVAVVQLVVPLVVIIGVPAAAARLPQHEVHLGYAGLIWIPFVVAAAVCAWLFMDSLTQARSDARSYVTALRHGQTWVMSILYIGTFGSFIGYSFALPLVIKNTFPEFLAANPFIATYLAGLGFMGALIGSVSRPFGGWLSDRIGGARVTLWCFLGMGVFTALAIVGVNAHSFALFFGAYMVIFMLSGAGNGSTYRMIPVIFGELGRKEAAEKGLAPGATALKFKREAAAVIGIAGAIGAFGGFLIQVVFRQASLGVTAKVAAADTVEDKLAVAQANDDWSTSALWVFLAGYVVFAAMTWFYYLRRSFAVARVRSLAHAGI